MKRICIYGKGGIGKSTVTANVAAAAAQAGRRVLVVGCDPKADTTRVLLHGSADSILELQTQNGDALRREQVCRTGAFGVRCIESGGPRAGEGCAGKGISLALKTIAEMRIIEDFSPELILYDVLGDVVCGGFSTPLRANVADTAYIVTTSDYMALYAANNISACIRKFAGRGGCKLGGLILNERSANVDAKPVEAFAAMLGTQIVARVPQDRAISLSELRKQTVIEGDPEAPSAAVFRALAGSILRQENAAIPTPLSREQLEALGAEMAERLLADGGL